MMPPEDVIHVLSYERRRARKQHCCSECKGLVLPTQEYQSYVFKGWNGFWQIKICPTCTRDWERIEDLQFMAGIQPYRYLGRIRHALWELHCLGHLTDDDQWLIERWFPYGAEEPELELYSVHQLQLDFS